MQFIAILVCVIICIGGVTMDSYVAHHEFAITWRAAVDAGCRYALPELQNAIGLADAALALEVCACLDDALNAAFGLTAPGFVFAAASLVGFICTIFRCCTYGCCGHPGNGEGTNRYEMQQEMQHVPHQRFDTSVQPKFNPMNAHNV